MESPPLSRTTTEPKLGLRRADAVWTEVAGTVAGVELLVDEEMLAAGAHVRRQ